MRKKPVVIPIGTKLADAQREIVTSTLEALGHNQTKAAGVLGISRMTIYTLLRRNKRPGKKVHQSNGVRSRRRVA